MERRNSDISDERTRLLPKGRNNSVSGIVFNSNISARTVFEDQSTLVPDQKDENGGAWGGRASLPDSGGTAGRLRRAQSWSGGLHDDIGSEIRILRERLLRTQTRLRPGAVRLLSKRQRLTLASLAMVDFMSFCSMSIMAPFFPREATTKGMTDTTCGFVFSFYAVVMFLTSPIFGKFLPVIGARFLFTSGMFVAGICNVLFGTLVLVKDTTAFTILCFVVRGLEALGASAFSTASYVFVVNAFPDNIGSVLGILEVFVGLGMSVGPAIGGYLYSIGGFSLPFYTLGIVMVVTVPINFFLLTDCDEYVSGSKTASIFQLFKIPSIIVTGLVIVVMSNAWAFLDPTLEPHMRQYGLSTKQIGLIFLLFSGLYGIFSPIWGWVADRIQNHWCMMVWGLFFSAIGLLLLGPCPFIPGLPLEIWLDLVALSILGISVSLALLPTFQGVLASSISEGGCPEALTTYSAVAGVWSCCYSLGEVLGPALGGAITERLGFPLSATLCAAACFTMGVVALTFFSLRESSKWVYSESETLLYTDTASWNSGNYLRVHSAPDIGEVENSPLVTPCSCSSKNGYYSYGILPQRHLCLKHHKPNKSGSASVADVIAYILKFQYLVHLIVTLRKTCTNKGNTNNSSMENSQLYQNYLDDQKEMARKQKCSTANGIKQKNNNVKHEKETGDSNYCTYLENAIFGSPAVVENINNDHLLVKRNNKGLVPTLLAGENRRTSEEIIKNNLEKVYFFEQNQACSSPENIFDCGCRDGVTYVRGTVAVSSTGACEV